MFESLGEYKAKSEKNFSMAAEAALNLNRINSTNGNKKVSRREIAKITSPFLKPETSILKQFDRENNYLNRKDVESTLLIRIRFKKSYFIRLVSSTHYCHRNQSRANLLILYLLFIKIKKTSVAVPI